VILDTRQVLLGEIAYVQSLVPNAGSITRQLQFVACLVSLGEIAYLPSLVPNARTVSPRTQQLIRMMTRTKLEWEPRLRYTDSGTKYLRFPHIQ
jgi:hypothetical protein